MKSSAFAPTTCPSQTEISPIRAPGTPAIEISPPLGSTRPRALIRSVVTLRSTSAPRFAEIIDSGCQEQAAWLKTAARISPLTIPWAEPEITTLDTWWFAASETLIMFGGPALSGVMMRSSQPWIVWERWAIQLRPIAVAGLLRGGLDAGRLHQGRDSAPSASSTANHRTFILAWFVDRGRECPCPWRYF